MAEDGDSEWSTTTPSFRFRWDVFLSFRGEDTRHKFTGRLYTELVQNGVRTFFDEDGLHRGNEIAPSLVTAIEDSAAAIAVISEKYANSWWCLEELAKIIECRKLLLPVFYEVDPSDVRRQTGPFKEDLRKLEDRFGVEKVLRWRKAMEKAGGIAGWDTKVWRFYKVISSLELTVFVGKKLYKRWYLYNTFFTDWYKWSSAEWPWRLIAFQRLSFTSADILACVKESNVIGMGSTGIVYKAEIQRPHSIVAVKKLWRSDVDVESGDDLFREVNLLGRLRHRNIVRRLGYLHNENDVIMVYEYMPNGNLGEALHGENATKMLVDWVSRYNITVGVANGLAYLHHDCNPPVIHRDVKSSNILLDADFEAKIADFGLARTMIQKNETVSMVAGSYGYIAPEYGYTLKIDEKSDIYSLDVALF